MSIGFDLTREAKWLPSGARLAACLANALAAFPCGLIIVKALPNIPTLHHLRGRKLASSVRFHQPNPRTSMMEDCAPGMSISHGCTDDSDVIEIFKEALKQRVGEERFQIWFSAVRFEFAVADSAADSTDCQTPINPGARSIVAFAHGKFAAERLAKDYLSAMRGAAASACGQTTHVRIDVDATPARQVQLPFTADGSPNENAPESTDHTPAPSATDDRRTSPSRRQNVAARNHGSRGKTKSLHAILRDGTDTRKPARPKTAPLKVTSLNETASPDSPVSETLLRETPPSDAPSSKASPAAAGPDAKTPTGRRSDCSWENFVASNCNELARTACKMAIENPALASPLVLWGPPGSGKTHLLSAVAAKLRSLHRLRRVVYLSAEEFTNDFIKALNANCLPAFRSRFRDADALIIDDIQFFVDKKATIRELHHTIEMLAEFGKPLVFAGTKSPAEIKGLGGELSGRLASGLVCQVESLDAAARLQLLSRYADERCLMPWPQETLKEIAHVASGDGRLLGGIVNLVALLQRMYGQMPTLDQIRQHGGHLLRSAGVPITLSAIERAVEKVFQLETKALQSESQTKTVTGPRMLAMYLSRELTSSAFSEIGGHFGGRSHSTAILANQRVRQWLDSGSPIGRGRAALSTDEAIRRIESMLKTG